MKVGKNIQILSLEKRRAVVNMIVPFGASYGASGAPVESAVLLSLSAPAFSLTGGPTSMQPPEFASVDQIVPKDGDFIYPIFRALSAVIIPGHWVDFSKDGVLKKSVGMLYGQTVYKNHGEAAGWFGKTFDVEKWLGAISQTVWDEKGDKVGGIPGINVELKIDALLNPRIARGLLMKPPAIHSVSVTVEFDYDYSHPELVEQDRFWRMLGEEVDGEIVRFVVTEIWRYLEISLVFQGADSGAKQVPDDEDEEFSLADEVARSLHGRDTHRLRPVPITKKETHTVKLTAEQKTALGITLEGEEIPDADVIRAATSFAQRAGAADQIIAAERAEVLRLATLAEAGADGALSPVLAEMIGKADASQLAGFKTLYGERAQAKFKPTCQSCGSQNVANRSSVEDASQLPEAGAKTVPVTTTGAGRLH